MPQPHFSSRQKLLLLHHSCIGGLTATCCGHLVAQHVAVIRSAVQLSDTTPFCVPHVITVWQAHWYTGAEGWATIHHTPLCGSLHPMTLKLHDRFTTKQHLGQQD